MWKPTDTSARQMVHSSTLDTITEHKSPRATTVKTCRPIFCLPSTISIVHHIRTPLWYPINWFFCCLRHKWLQLQLFIIILHNHLYSALMLSSISCGALVKFKMMKKRITPTVAITFHSRVMRLEFPTRF